MVFENNREGIVQFAYELYLKIKRHGTPIFLCVGSDKWVCDSLAPIVAEILKKEYNIGAYVYGGLDYNINAQNLVQAINYIETVHKDCTVVLIDATLGESVGKIELKEGCFAGMGKCLPIKKIGTISILGVVGKYKNFDLNSTRLKLIMELSRFIAIGCFVAVEKYNQTNIDNEYKVSTK